MTSVDVVLVEIRRVVRDELRSQRSVELTDELVRDLEFDSVTLVTLLVALEDHFRVVLREDETAGVVTVLDLARLVAERISHDASGGALSSSGGVS
jgi:acyl carrier protein